ncbi:MAG: SPOR domain-containing protein [Planctomycetes bacterium]|nr:SPOR domain-containing protein [Planctomycetota bacterium]
MAKFTYGSATWLAACLLAGCGGAVPPSSSAILRAGLDAYKQGDDAAAIDRMDRFISLHAKSQQAGEAHYVRALARSRRGDLPGAKSDFSYAVTLTRRNDLTGLANLGMALLAEQGSNDDEAKRYYLAALQALPQGAAGGDEALFRLACLLQRHGQWLEADRYFDRLVLLYGNGDLAAAGRHRVRGRGWTIQTGAFAQRGNATKQQDRLSQVGLNTRITAVRGATLLFAVRVGRYQTHSQALQALPQVRKIEPAAMVTIARE